MASQEGYLYVYQVSPDGGDCRLIVRHDLRNFHQSTANELSQKFATIEEAVLHASQMDVQHIEDMHGMWMWHTRPRSRLVPHKF